MILADFLLVFFARSSIVMVLGISMVVLTPCFSFSWGSSCVVVCVWLESTWAFFARSAKTSSTDKAFAVGAGACCGFFYRLLTGGVELFTAFFSLLSLVTCLSFLNLLSSEMMGLSARCKLSRLSRSRVCALIVVGLFFNRNVFLGFSVSCAFCLRLRMYCRIRACCSLLRGWFSLDTVRPEALTMSIKSFFSRFLTVFTMCAMVSLSCVVKAVIPHH